MSPATFDWLAAMLRTTSGLTIGRDKTYLLETRLAPLLKQAGLRDLDDLTNRLRAPGAGELQRDVVEAMTTNESFFFRDEKPFVHLRSHGLPQLHAARNPGTRLRIWSAAASSGQEAYSLAMTTDELRPRLGGREVEIVGTDISREQLARARGGFYTQFEIQRGLPMQMLVKYFRKEAGQWRICEALRGMTTFREWNLLSDLRPLGVFDVIFCRNVMIYFDPPTKSRVLEALAAQLAPDGLLYLGGAESILGLTSRLVGLPNEWGVYEHASPAVPTASRMALAR